MTHQNFNWGNTPPDQIDLISEENFISRTYEQHYKIKENSVVVDVGANYGAFSYSIKDSHPKIVYCIEPSKKIFPILKENLKDMPCVFVNKGISDVDSDEKYIDNETFIYEQEDTYSSIKFSTFIHENNIKTIDFLKFDCEGGEISIFNEENLDFIKTNVKIISGEYHICNFSNSVEQFIKFRNLYLSELEGTPHIHVYDRFGKDITKEIFNDYFILHFKNTYDICNPSIGQFIIHANLGAINPNKIPVIGTAVVNSSYWVSRLIMSVDYPVETFVIINNNGRGELDDELDSLKKLNKKFIDNIKICHMPANIGCSGAWNLIIKCFMNSPYWIIVNDDVAFGSGLLKEFYDTANNDSDIGMIHAGAGDFNLGAWDLFLIRDHVIKEFGLFDENCYPAYMEDADYIMRFAHRPIKKVAGLTSKYYHGHLEGSSYYEENGGGQTKKSNPELREKLEIVNQTNFEYMYNKWGQGWRTCCPYQFPYNNESIPITYTTYDLEFVRSKNLGF